MVRRSGEDGFEKMVDRVANLERAIGIADLNRFTPRPRLRIAIAETCANTSPVSASFRGAARRTRNPDFPLSFHGFRFSAQGRAPE